MDIRTQCEDAIVGAFLGIFAKEEAAIVESAKGTMGVANAAVKDINYHVALGEEALAKAPSHPLAQAWDWMTNAGAPRSIPAGVLEPDVILPKSFVGPAITKMQQWVERNGLSPLTQQKKSYVAEVVPTLKDLKARVKLLPEHLQRYANDYVNDYLAGGEFFDLMPQKGGGSAQVVKAATKNVLKNSVAFNQIIAGLNVIEWIPKTLAEHGPVNTLAAVGQVVRNSRKTFGVAPNLWGKIPELEHLGVYGSDMANAPKIDTLAWTETFNKGIYYYAGSFGKDAEAGLKSVEKLGFKYRPGNAPSVFRSQYAASDLALMRYGIGQGRLLGGWAHDLSGRIVAYRDGKLSVGMPEFGKMATGAAALSTWLLAQSALTGVKSTGVVLYDVLPDDYKATLDEYEDVLPLNIIKKATGVDLSQKMKPGGLTFGVGQQILSQDLGGIARGVGKVREGVELDDGDTLTEGVIDIAVNGLMLAPTTKIKVGDTNLVEIGNANIKKFGALAKKIVTNELDPSDPEAVQAAVIEKFVGPQEAAQ